jgi:glucoamylase
MSGVAFGVPGIAPTWCSSDKDFVTTALGASRLWATIGHGIVNEVYWPSTGEPQIRDFGFYLAGDAGWGDLKRVRRYRLSTPGPHLPALTVTHYGDDYQLALEILPDPRRDVLLVRFNLEGPYRLIVILAPHLGSTGSDNSAWVDAGVGYAPGMATCRRDGLPDTARPSNTKCTQPSRVHAKRTRGTPWGISGPYRFIRERESHATRA